MDDIIPLLPDLFLHFYKPDFSTIKIVN